MIFGKQSPGLRKGQASQTTNQHSGLRSFYRHTYVSQALDTFHLFLVHWWMFIFFQTITLCHPYDGLRVVSVVSGSTFAWQGSVDSRLRDKMFLSGRIARMPSTLSCWSLFQLTIKPTQHGWALTPTYSINHRRPSLSYFLHPGQQNTLHVVLKLSSDH